jgi:hypothetical protein
VWPATFVFACALDVLGRRAASVPPVQFVAQPPPGVSRFAQGYVRPDTGEIVLITSTEAFTQARRDRCEDLDAIREVASVLVHEEWHVRHGPDEAGAYDAQLMALFTMGANPDGRLFRKIQQAKLAVLATATHARSADVMARQQPPDDSHPLGPAVVSLSPRGR